MKIDTLLLADAATASEGKIYVHGGGLTNITPPFFPWTHPQLAIVFRVVVEPGDEAEDHEMVIEILDPEGAAVVPELKVPMPRDSIPPREEEDEVIYLMGALTLAGLPLQTVGMHHVRLTVDDSDVTAEHPLRVKPSGPD